MNSSKTDTGSNYRIALLLPLDISFCRHVLHGIRAYTLGKQQWVFRLGSPHPDIISPLRSWQPDGIIAHIVDHKLAQAVTELHKPTVDTANTLPDLKIPTIDVDNNAVGKMAAEHFLERRYTNFGFFGSRQARYASQRETGFRQRLAKEGYEVSSCHMEYLPQLPIPTNWNQVDQCVMRWLRKLPKPVAVFTSNDQPASDLAGMCKQLELQVPDEVAILGVDNDESICEMTAPPISSIAIPSERIGYKIASLLERLLLNQALPKSPDLLLPQQVITRQSTDTLAINDPAVAAALKFIRQHAADEISVNDVTTALCQGRRMLECKFRKLLGRTILEEIRRVRIEIAKNLLVSTNLSMPAVAHRAGFSNAERFSVVFREATGIPPSDFRKSQTIHNF